MDDKLVRIYVASQREMRAEAERLRAEIERVHQLLDEYAMEGDGTEPLLERVGRAIDAAYAAGYEKACREASVSLSTNGG